ASKVFTIEPADITHEQRRRIKAMNYGLAYGLSSYGLGQQLGITPAEASVLMDDYFTRFGGVRDYLHQVVGQARRDGYTQTLLGRRRYLPDLTSDNRQRREMAEQMALNAPLQGSSADIHKVAMLHIDAAVPSPSHSPYTLLLGLIARLTGLSALTVLWAAGPPIVVLLMWGLRGFVRRFADHPYAPALAFVFVLLLWGVRDRLWSGFLS